MENFSGWSWMLYKERHAELLRAAEHARLLQLIQQSNSAQHTDRFVALQFIGKALIHIGSRLESLGASFAGDLKPANVRTRGACDG
uniref:Uncharacterized protein n=1 Tax=Caldilinea aerophila TaxID=133453 RepID=A0A7C1JUS0_9CHLR